MQIAVNHGMMPAGISGTLPPDLLVSQATAKQAEAQLELARMQQAAQQEAQRLNAEIMAHNAAAEAQEAAE